MTNPQLGVNSGGAAHALARFILDNVADDPSEAGVFLTQQPYGIYVSADLASADISLNGDMDEN